jgi:cell division protein FtsL
MIKILHVVAIGALISSAMYAYTIKYETLYHGEQLTKLKARVLKEREAIAVLKAEWQHLNRPERLQMLAERHLQLQPLQITQIVRFSDVPNRGPKVDSIAQKLDSLGADPRPTASIAPRAAASSVARPKPAVAATPRPPATGLSRPVTPRPAQSARPATQAAQAANPRPAASPNAPMVLRPPAPVPQVSRPAQR